MLVQICIQGILYAYLIQHDQLHEIMRRRRSRRRLKRGREEEKAEKEEIGNTTGTPGSTKYMYNKLTCVRWETLFLPHPIPEGTQ